MISLCGLNFTEYVGREQTFQAIDQMIESMEPGQTYYHFIGYPDETWNQLGMADRARREVVPKKVAKGLKTVGLYYPAPWILDKFGGEKAKTEFREIHLLPKDVIVFSRYYVYDNNVLHIIEQENDFNGLQVEGKWYADAHKNYLLIMAGIKK